MFIRRIEEHPAAPFRLDFTCMVKSSLASFVTYSTYYLTVNVLAVPFDVITALVADV